MARATSSSVLQAGQIIQILLHRLQAIGLDGRGVHEGVIEIAQLLLFRRQLVVRLLLQVVDDGRMRVLAEDLQILERAGLGAVGGMSAVFSQSPLT